MPTHITANAAARRALEEIGMTEPEFRARYGVADEVVLSAELMVMKMKAREDEKDRLINEFIKSYGQQFPDKGEQPTKVEPRMFRPEGHELTSQVAPIRYDDRPTDARHETLSSKFRTKLSTALSATRTFLIRFIG